MGLVPGCQRFSRNIVGKAPAGTARRSSATLRNQLHRNACNCTAAQPALVPYVRVPAAPRQQQRWAQRGSVMSWRCWSREKPASLKAGLLYRLCRSVMLYSLARSSNDLVHDYCVLDPRHNLPQSLNPAAYPQKAHGTRGCCLVRTRGRKASTQHCSIRQQHAWRVYAQNTLCSSAALMWGRKAASALTSWAH